MKITKKRLTSFLLAVVMVLSLLPMGALDAFAAQKSDYYVAVGDGVTANIYGADGRVKGNYTFMLADMKGYLFDEDSLIAGNYTSDYARELLETDEDTRNAVSKAGLVTVMLGVEDMMYVVYQAMAEKYNATEEEKIVATQVPQLINGTIQGNKKQLMFNALPLLNADGNDYLIKSTLFTDAVNAFSENLSAIVAAIKELAPEATLLVATQYNPMAEYYKHTIKIPLTSSFSMDYDLTSLYQCMEDGVTVLNEQIKKNAASDGYQVVDIKAAFDEDSSGDDLYEAHAGDTLSTLSWDIMPTEKGYQVMAAAFAEKTPDAPKYHKVSFDANGGAGAMSGLVIEEGSFTLPVNEFTAAKGYEFAGWALSQDGKVIDKTAITVDQDITLYAIWKVQPLKGEVTISGTMQVGSKLTVAVSNTNNSGALTYQWYKDNTLIHTGETYTLAPSDVAATLYCVVTSDQQTGSLKSKETAKIQPKVFDDGEIEFLDYVGTYDGKFHTFTEKVPAGITVEYSIDGTTVDDEKPEFNTAGVHTVSYSVTKPGYDPVTGTVQVVIERKMVTVTADAYSIGYGDKEPKLTYKAEGLVGAETLEGALTRDAGANVGVYQIKQGTLTNENNPNYDIVFTGNTFTIGKVAADYVAPTGLTAVYGQKLADIKLPTGFKWQSPNSFVGDVGTNNFLVIYTPADTLNYEGAVVTVEVKVIEAPNNIRVDFDNKLGNVTGAGAYEDGVTVKLTATPAAGAKFEYWVDASVDLTGKLSEAELKAKIISKELTYSFTAESDVHLQAVFAPEKIEIVPMLLTGTDAKALTEAKRLNTTQNFGGISWNQCPIKLSVNNEIKKEFTEGEKLYKFAGFIVSGYDKTTNARTVELKSELVLELQPLYGSAEYKEWLEPVAGGIYAAYMENTSMTGDGNSKNPSTGDNSDMVMWLVILVFCAGGIALLMVIDRKKQKKK